MISIINATNRPGNRTQLFTQLYFERLQEKGVLAQYASLEQLNTIRLDDLFELKNHSSFKDFTSKYIKDVNKIVIISPEYNGSYTGILKLLIDNSEYQLFKNKKIALIGTSTGRAGNLRGLDHLTNIFHYLEAQVLHLKIPISSINQFINNEKVTDKSIKDLFDKQIDLFLEF
ncbi:MAG: NAD(P)H-dependent oxidoreductase [Bacteroidota bacterium]